MGKRPLFPPPPFLILYCAISLVSLLKLASLFSDDVWVTSVTASWMPGTVLFACIFLQSDSTCLSEFIRFMAPSVVAKIPQFKGGLRLSQGTSGSRCLLPGKHHENGSFATWKASSAAHLLCFWGLWQLSWILWFYFMAWKDTLPVLQPGKNKCPNNFLSFVKAEIGCHNAVGAII